jgi:integrase
MITLLKRYSEDTVGVEIRKRRLKDGRTSLYLDIISQGRRTYEFLKVYLNGDPNHDREKLRLVKQIRNNRETELLSHAHGLIATHAGKVPLCTYVESRVNHAALLEHLKVFFKGLRLDALDESGVVGFQEYLLSKVQPGTAKVYMARLNSTLNQAVREKLILRNPAAVTRKIKRTEKVIEFLSDDEIKALAETPIKGGAGRGGQIKKAFLFACFTGLRYSDLQKLIWGEIRTIEDDRVNSSKKRNRREIVFTQKKTGGVVRVEVNEVAWSLINPGDRLPDRAEKVFHLGSNNMAAQYLPEWGKRAKLSIHLHFHISRHTFATRALEAGADPFTLKSILGHAKIEMSLHYAQVTSKLRQKVSDGTELELLYTPKG